MLKVLKIGETAGTALSIREVSGFIFQDVRFDPARIPLHTHEDAHISILLEGCYTQSCYNHTFEFKPIMLSFHPAGETHSNKIASTGSREFVIWLKKENFRRLSHRVCVLNENKQFAGGNAVKTSIRLYKEFRNTDKISDLALEAMILELLVSAEREITKRSYTKPPFWVIRIREYLHDNYLKEFSMDDLVMIAGVHRTYLARSFRQHFGYSLGDYVRCLRIEAARKELAQGKNPISDIALSYGFYDQAHFTKVFKTHFGTTPAAYRRRTFQR